jgi:hypothetical protein
VHLYNPETVFLLQHATRQRRYDVFREYTDTVERLNREGGTLRGLFALREGVRPAVPLDEFDGVEVTRLGILADPTLPEYCTSWFSVVTETVDGTCVLSASLPAESLIWTSI